MQKKQTSFHEKRPVTTPPRSGVLPDDSGDPEADAPVAGTPVVQERSPRPRSDHLLRKVSVEFGERRTSDMKVILVGKQGFCVKLSVHKTVLAEKSSFFAGKIVEVNSELPCLQIDDCEDAELYVEVVGLMYCNDMKQRMIKKGVSRVLLILRVAETLGFRQCIRTCLQYLEAVPWVGEEEEQVISSILHLQSEGLGATPVLKRVSSETSSAAVDTLSRVLDLVLKSSEDRGRKETKLDVLKLLMENCSLPSYAGSSDICNQTIYDCCRSCLNSLSSSFKQASDTEFRDRNSDSKEPVVRQIALEADNLSWLLEILAERHAADDFAMMWASQDELASLHVRLPTVSRYHVSCITARLFVGIGKGQLLPSKETRLLLMKTWLQPLINDYWWLQHGCRSFDRKIVEEGIGRTILTLPLEDQQSILLSWLGSFLKSGDSCPNLQRAFEVWWRRTFVRPFVETQPRGQSLHSESLNVCKLGNSGR
ncbi:hypothetical protein MLD38_004630 [Melastoma candidum]|uniref:Uncharacterized protein n=1 Tax=Melastoma candidum TaxID=119954 RepID=A0ACB9SEW1_9MYRT|nr:hypothetical protein MLD38_004630 [Melastoma candidum]